MSYVLVNAKDTNATLHISNWGWWAVRALLVGAGWQAMGATGHWDIMTDTAVVVPLDTDADKWNSYEGCSLQLVREEDARAMLEAARHGISLCESDPDGTITVIHILLGDRKDAEKTPEDIANAVKEIRSLLQEFADFAEHGAFFLD